KEAVQSIDKTDSLNYKKGHIMAQGTTNHGTESIGYSTRSKVWSNRYEQIPLLLSWCKMVAGHLRSRTTNKTSTNLDMIKSAEPIDSLSEGVLFCDWETPYYNECISYNIAEGQRISKSLLDIVLQIDRAKST